MGGGYDVHGMHGIVSNAAPGVINDCGDSYELPQSHFMPSPPDL